MQTDRLLLNSPVWLQHWHVTICFSWLLLDLLHNSISLFFFVVLSIWQPLRKCVWSGCHVTKLECPGRTTGPSTPVIRMHHLCRNACTHQMQMQKRSWKWLHDAKLKFLVSKYVNSYQFWLDWTGFIEGTVLISPMWHFMQGTNETWGRVEDTRSCNTRPRTKFVSHTERRKCLLKRSSHV